MADLTFLGTKVVIKKINDAIKIGDRPIIVKCLRHFAETSTPLPAEITAQLADYLDLDRPAIKSGPKGRKNLVRNFKISEQYKLLCENLGFARAMINADMTAFKLEKPINFFQDGVQPFPGWIYPHRERDREAHKEPTREDIKDYICRGYKISRRTLDTILAETKREDAIIEYDSCMIDNLFFPT